MPPSLCCHSYTTESEAKDVPYRFNQLLEEAGIDPASTRLLRHKEVLLCDKVPYELWLDDRAAFEEYQQHQLHGERARFAGRYWASFAGLRDDRTVFLGIYEVDGAEQLLHPYHFAASGKQFDAGMIDRYSITRTELLSEFSERLFIDWGPGKRSWQQRADYQDKRVTELRQQAQDASFPGLMHWTAPASRLSALPAAWREHLALARGVYLLSCPRTGELYVGSASGEQGFWGRWTSYEVDGHGGNIALKLRERSDLQISILQVAGSSETPDSILAAEALWKSKLGSREFGLNRN
jgi:hypothetical protein